MAPTQPSQRRSSDLSQHAMPISRLSLNTTDPNIFSDENALDSVLPTPESASSPSHGDLPLQISSDPSPPPLSVNQPSDGRPELRQSGGTIQSSSGLRRESSSARKSAYRVSGAEASKASLGMHPAFAIPRTQSPYQGATGPSHPYGMYPQDIGISRNPSSATAASVRATERTHPGAGGPTQPYGMYPQSTVPEDESVLASEVIPPMPGFPGRARDYQRRFGADTEEAADIVGPDGYTEQLPAYTRYANDIPPKASQSIPAMSFREPTNPGVSRVTLDTATSDDSMPRSAPVEGSLTPLRASAAEAAVPPPDVSSSASASTQSASEGGHFKERVKDGGKKRICCGMLPMWLLMVFLVIGACVVGGMIGGILGRAKAAAENSHTQESSTPYV